MMLGKSERRYAQVHISNRITDNRLWKLKSALYNGRSIYLLFYIHFTNKEHTIILFLLKTVSKITN